MNRFLPFFLFLLLTTSLLAQSQAERVPGNILVQLAPKVSPAQLVRSLSYARKHSSLAPQRLLHAGANMHVLAFDEAIVSGEELLATIRQSPLVLHAQFNHYLQYRGLNPDDTNFDEQWALRKIQAPEVWEVTTGGLTANGDTIVVAVMDGGCQLNHEDLQNNIWRNHAEIPNDGIDNDNNRYVDDYFGLKVSNSTDGHAVHQHGTSVAGVIGAEGNNGIGVSGVNWNIKMMILSDVGLESEVVEAMFYAFEQRKKYNETNGAEGAFVVACNYSLGVDAGNCETEFPLWNPTLDSLGTEGVLVIGAGANKNWNVDEVGDVPTTCTSDFLIGVTNTNQLDEKVLGAAYGAKSIDLGSPGNGVYTTRTEDGYSDIFGGTSAATPQVAGAIGLMYSYPCEGLANDALRQPASTALLMKDFLLNGVDVVESMVGRTVSDGRLNINNSLKLLEGYYGQERGGLGFVKIKPNPARDVITISVSLPDFEDYDLTIYDMVGKKIDNSLIPGHCTSPEIEIPIDFLTPGVYSLVLENPQNFATGRFVVH